MHSISRRRRSLTGFFCSVANLQAVGDTVGIATPALFLANPTARKERVLKVAAEQAFPDVESMGEAVFGCKQLWFASQSHCGQGARRG